MRKLLTLDARDYEEGLPEIRRVAARGIILIGGRLLLTENQYGEVKLPGAGVEPGENEVQALIREVKEETGYTVIPATVRPFGEIEEKRLSIRENAVWHQISRLYTCAVGEERAECRYFPNERQAGFRCVLYPIGEALRKNEAMLDREGERTYNQREYQTLLLIREAMEKGEIACVPDL